MADKSDVQNQKEINRQESSSGQWSVSVPAISLPKGGGAIRGMGEKFAANPVTGTGSITIPIATSPGRLGFGPQLSMSYDSGAGNGPFGLGWHLSVPSISRKTDKGLPKYMDGIDQVADSDVFILSGAEDLVPQFERDANGEWIINDGKYVTDDNPRTVAGKTYRIRRYRPRIEGLFARIERWTNVDKSHDVHWRSISKDNVLTVYGKDENSRIYDPADAQRIFSWLISETRDDKGNAIIYTYREEETPDALLSKANEQNRGAVDNPRRKVNRYIDRILYGNRTSLLDNSANRPSLLTQKQIDSAGWMFEVAFDYCLPQKDTGDPGAIGSWTVRNDPFSSYRAGFEIRTYRLCHRILMFHHFPQEAGVGDNCLVRSTNFKYNYEDNPDDARNPIYSCLLSVTQIGYQRNDDGVFSSKSLPPVEFSYTEAVIDNTVRDVNGLENLPVGLDNATYQWADLDGEGLSGILSEQATDWFYKRNLSPLPSSEKDAEQIEARFSPVELITTKPALSLFAAQFMDLAGDGQHDLVTFNNAVPGFFKRTEDASWESFRPFRSWPNLDTRDLNLKFVDVDGDGLADILISEDEVFRWYPAMAEDGFGDSEFVRKPFDEEAGPALVFADGTQSIYLSDMSGDGLSDIVRIRNGEICYWPNLGYGRFGSKVTMDNAPWFDSPDLFDQKRIRLADIDGSGTTDVIYLHSSGVRLYFNQSGNSWSSPDLLAFFPQTNNLTSVTTVDLLGNGTACLVWSSPLAGDASRSMRYIKLMEQKPHLLVSMKNNLGMETTVQYAPSTKFYLKDKQNGKPWITRLPFPVHCVEKITMTDMWRNTRFSTTYSYHHGYFDGIEREFRGFGRVEQIDTEDYGTFAQGNAASPYITDKKELYQPPVKTVTWYHTGAYLNQEQILDQYKQEYFSVPGFTEHTLPEPALEGANLNGQEWREALRACKGMMLRQEVFEMDIDALESGKEIPVRLFTSTFHNCDIRLLQPMASNRHAVFHVIESEAITYHYELDLQPTTIEADPRIAHTLNIKIDDYGNVQQSVSAVYPRINKFSDSSFKDDDVALINDLQSKVHLSYTENRFTDDDAYDDNNHRRPTGCQSRNYELTGIDPTNNYYSMEQLREYDLSDFYKDTSAKKQVAQIDYQQMPDGATPQKRLVEESRMLYFDQSLKNPLSFGKLSVLGLLYEKYKLALTDTLLNDIFAQKLTDVESNLADVKTSGYLSGTELTSRLGADTANQYWMRSGIAGYADNAPQYFYLPERYTDAFENTTLINYDKNYLLYVESTTDPAANTVSVQRFDFRVLAPAQIKDINNNISEVCFDILGMPTVMALKGKGAEADNLDGFDEKIVNPDVNALINFFTSEYNESEARSFLGNATARHLYCFGEKCTSDGSITWGAHPPCSCAILREKHVALLDPGTNEVSPLQTAFEYSDGTGSVLVKKVQAEPDADGGKLRWIANGKTILNNKGKSVKQYEPYFTETQCFEESREFGVSPVMYYDALGRLIRTDMPDGTFSRIAFSPWDITTFDPNDTVLEPGNVWYSRMTSDNATTEQKRAAALATVHAGTPAVSILDSLGREFITVAHNRVADPADPININGCSYEDEKYLIFKKLDAEGNPLWIKDARGNIVMRCTVQDAIGSDPTKDFFPAYDIAGNLLFQHSMDAGDQWMFNDSAGKPMYAWEQNACCDENGNDIDEQRLYYNSYDVLHRPTKKWLTVNSGVAQLVVDILYGEDISDADYARSCNMRGQLYQQYDQSGLKMVAGYDFKGNTVEVQRQAASKYKAEVIGWQDGSETSGLEGETFIQITEYDALNRMSRLFNWHKGINSRVAVYEPSYNQRGLLGKEELVIRAIKKEEGYVEDADSRHSTPLKSITYNAKGQKEMVLAGNNTITRYEYDPQTFRLQQLRTARPDYDPPFPGNPSPLNDSNVLQDLYYMYDPIGNITEIRDWAYETAFFKNQMIEPRSLYVYDALYRLTSAGGRENINLANDAPGQYEPDPLQSKFPLDTKALRNYTQYYTYDHAGNITEMKHVANGGGWTRSYDYANDSNRLSRTWLGNDTINAVLYRHDKRGNLRNLANTDPKYFMQWDYNDMIRSLNLEGGGWAYYNYDSVKQRTRKVIENKDGVIQWERFYLGGFEVYRKYSGGVLVEEIETHHLMDGNSRLLLVEDVISTGNAKLGTGPLYHYQYGNHLGSAVMELDEQAAIISYEEYHPYGTTSYHAVDQDIKAAAKRYRYTGKERDDESGLYYHGARYYAPWLGRWTAMDPIGISDDINVYAYVKGNPICKKDPSGTAGVNMGEVFDAIIEHLNKTDEPFEVGKYKLIAVRMDIDENFPVGAKAISPKEARARAVDVNARQFKESILNRRTKHLGLDTHAYQPYRSPVSVEKDPVALIERRFGEIKEMRNIFQEALGKVGNRGSLEPTALKEKINSNIWEIIKNSQSKDAINVRTALEKIGFQNIKDLGFVQIQNKAGAGLEKLEAQELANLAEIFKTIKLNAEAAEKVIATKSVKKTLPGAVPLSPNDIGLSGINEYSLPHQEATTSGVEGSTSIFKKISCLWNEAVAAIGGEEDPTCNPPVKQKPQIRSFGTSK